MTKNRVKLSFKKGEKPTGLWSIGHSHPDTEIKLDKKTFGHIIPPAWNTVNYWRIHFAVIKPDINEDGNPNCEWRWREFKQEFETEPEAREYMKNNIEYILEHYKLYFFES